MSAPIEEQNCASRGAASLPRAHTSDSGGLLQQTGPNGRFWIVHGRNTPLHRAIALAPEEQRVLTFAAMAGGSVTISDLAPKEMLQTANTALALKHRGMGHTWIRFCRHEPGQPEVVLFEITPEGRRALRCVAPA